MAMANARLLTLFDPSDNHDWCDTRYIAEIFIRFIESVLCLNHIRDIQGRHPELGAHLFFPDVQIENIYSRRQEFEKTIKYIYCRENSSINSIRKTYGRPFSHKIFTVDGLEFEINHVHIGLLYALAQQAPAFSPERDRLLATASGELDMAQHSLRQMMTEQPGQSPTELH
jgi:hypothetical protein